MTCRRCLLSDMASQKPLNDLINEVISTLDESKKASDALYQQRLRACKECDWLIGGLCGLCGCYVQVRAAQKGQSCPDTKKKWTIDTLEL